jgi:hypothetical protein
LRPGVRKLADQCAPRRQRPANTKPTPASSAASAATAKLAAGKPVNARPPVLAVELGVTEGLTALEPLGVELELVLSLDELSLDELWLDELWLDELELELLLDDVAHGPWLKLNWPDQPA